MLYYVFETKQLALDAENYISELGGAPITGKSACNNELQPTKCKTIRWAIPQERFDAKWVFPYVGDNRVAQFPQIIINNFYINFPHTKEEYDSNWFSETGENE